MKRRMHINDFLLTAIAKSLREAGREEDAQIFESIEGANWRTGYGNPGKTEFGSSGNPSKTSDGKIVAYPIKVDRKVTYPNGKSTTFGMSVLNTIAMIPKPYRPPYLGNITSSQANGKIDIAELGADLSKTGSYYISIDQNSNAKFVIVIGSDETPTDYKTVMKYMPFDTFPGAWSALRKADPSEKGYSASCDSSISYNDIFPFSVLVYSSTSPAVTEIKDMNPNLPDFKWNDFVPTVPKNYTNLGTLNLTVDWRKLAGRYKTKTHINQLFLDVIYEASVSAGNDDLATKIKGINVETFTPWNIEIDTANKKTKLIGARCSTAKVYFDSITVNNYNSSTAMRAIDFGFVYAAEAGINFETLTALADIKAKTDTALYAENTYGYFGKHVPKGSEFSRESLEEIIPFSISGLDIPITTRNITTDTQQYFSNQSINPVFLGNNGYRIYIYPDK